MSDKYEDHEEIFLEPLFEAKTPDDKDWYGPEGRTWCQDDVYHSGDYDGVSSTKYVRYDIYEKLREDLELVKRQAEENQKIYESIIARVKPFIGQ